MYTIEIKKKPEPKVITLRELLEWKTKMLEIEKKFLLEANNAVSDISKRYNQENADIVSNQLNFLDRLITQAASKGEKESKK